MEYIIENITDEEMKIIEKHKIEWYPDDMESRNVVIDGPEFYCDLVLELIGRKETPEGLNPIQQFPEFLNKLANNSDIDPLFKYKLAGFKLTLESELRKAGIMN